MSRIDKLVLTKDKVSSNAKLVGNFCTRFRFYHNHHVDHAHCISQYRFKMVTFTKSNKPIFTTVSGS